MSTIVGIDLSLTATGIAVITRGDPTPTLATVGERGRATDGLVQMTRRIRRQRDRIIAEIPSDTALVVIETLGRPHPKAPGMFQERAALRGMINDTLDLHGTAIADVMPAALKRWATGSGIATKTHMTQAMCALWPETVIANDNEADALALASLAAMQQGWITPSAHHHHQPKARWPDATV